MSKLELLRKSLVKWFLLLLGFSIMAIVAMGMIFLVNFSINGSFVEEYELEENVEILGIKQYRRLLGGWGINLQTNSSREDLQICYFKVNSENSLIYAERGDIITWKWHFWIYTETTKKECINFKVFGLD